MAKILPGFARLGRAGGTLAKACARGKRARFARRGASGRLRRGGWGTREMDRRLSRRLVAVRLGALGAAGTTAGCAVPPAPAWVPPPGARQGISDADPGDPAGAGRGGPRGPYRTGLSDADPHDPPGAGRGGARGAYRTGISDADPHDPPGAGRGAMRGPVRTGFTDSDPSDVPGNGRGGFRR
jgi:hypothetical protein